MKINKFLGFVCKSCNILGLEDNWTIQILQFTLNHNEAAFENFNIT